MTNTTKVVKTEAQQKAMQVKAEQIANSLNKEVIAVNEGKQHIQTKAGVAYELSLQDGNILDTSLIAKKVGNDLEVILEDSVVIFDNYFEVCTTDLSCLVSLPAEEGGLYHITAETFFNLEDGTQVVYFYGEQSIISTESSATSGTFQGFIDAFKALSPVGQAGAVLATATAISIVSSNNDNNGDAGKPAIAVKADGTGKAEFVLSLDEAVKITSNQGLNTANGTLVAMIKVNGVDTEATYVKTSDDGKEVTFKFTVPTIQLNGLKAKTGDTATVTFVELSLNGATMTKLNGTEAINLVDLNAGLKDSVVATLVVDATPPADLTIALEADTGSNTSDGITNNGKVMVSGEMEANATWKYSMDSGATWTTGAGTSFMLADNTSYAANAIQVKQVDAVGNDSGIKMIATAITVDKVAPAFSSADTGTGVTGQDIPVYTATVTDSDTVTYAITNAGTDTDKFTIDAQGKVKYKDTPTVAGTDTITITATDVAGNEKTKEVIITVFSKPVISSIAASETLIKGGEQVVFTLTMSEKVDVTNGSEFKITFKIGSGTDTMMATYTGGTNTNELTFTATAPTTGNGAVTIQSITLGTGTGAATVIGQTSNQGMLISQVNQAVSGFIIDNVAPAGLTLALEADTGSSDTDGITNNGKVMVSGLEANATWKYSMNGGTDWTDGTGNSFMLADATYAANAVQVKQIDKADNTSEVKMIATAITVDKTAPEFTSAATGQGIKNIDAEVYDAEVTGGDTGITYSISGSDAAKFTIGAADGKIKYTSAPTDETTTADNITITATDVAGNAKTQNVAISVIGKPVGSSSIDGATDVDVRSPIVLTFSEKVAVTANTTIKVKLTDTDQDEFIRDADGNKLVDDKGVETNERVGWKNDETKNDQEILVTSDMIRIVEVNGKSVVTIDPQYDFDFGTHYAIEIAEGAFTGVTSSQLSSAINMSFDTVTPLASTITKRVSDGKGRIGTQSHIQKEGVDLLVDSHWWIDGHQSNPTALPEVVQAEDRDIAVAVSLQLDGNVNEAGYIVLWGHTDANDIIYGDIANNTITYTDVGGDLGDRTEQFIDIENWSNDILATIPDDEIEEAGGFDGQRGAAKDFGSNLIRNGLSTSVVFSDIERNATTPILNDAEFNALDPSHGAVLYG